MSKSLCKILRSLLSLLSPNIGKSLIEGQTANEAKDYCHQLATSLDECKLEHADNLQNALTFLRTAISDLAVCYENLEGNDGPGTNLVDDANNDHLISYTPEGLKLERELREINADEKAKEKLEMVTKNFRKSAKECKTICENKPLSLQERITATKVRVITSILGNLHDLNVAYENCREVILELHTIQEIRSLFSHMMRAKLKWIVSKSDAEQIASTINLNKAVLGFRRKFLTNPVAIFDWPVFKEEENPQTFHPIIGQPPAAYRTMLDMPDPCISVETNGAELNARISAVNCKGEVFVVAKHKTNSSAVVLVANDTSLPFWSLTTEKAKELKMEENIQITSISTDTNECSTVSNSHNDCKNKVYVLAFYIPKASSSKDQSQSVRVFVLFVIDVQGKLLHKAELTCLPRRSVKDKVLCRIICIKEKLLILDAMRREVYLCTGEGDLEVRLDVTDQKPDVSLSTATVTDGNEIILLQKPNKLLFYNIDEGRFLDDQGFEAPDKVTINYAITFNHVTKEITLLYKVNSFFKTLTQLPEEHHLARYAKTGELRQDIRLQDDKCDFWKNASLISHPSGPLILLDNSRLLHLQ